MLADKGRGTASTGYLRADVHLPGTWLTSLIGFLANQLPLWRDDPRRPFATAETTLTSQLCRHLNSATHHSGWDYLQFNTETPDEALGGRSIDLTLAPSGVVIWIEGREYSEYRTLIPIECKRLPTPVGPKRDEREYLHSRHGTTGGVQRFKAGHHGATHAHAAMIAYVQNNDIPFWDKQINQWLAGLHGGGAEGWSADDEFTLGCHDPARRVAVLRSRHTRTPSLQPLTLDHLWVEM